MEYNDLFKEYNDPSGVIRTHQSRSNVSQSRDRFSGFDQWCGQDEPRVRNQESEGDLYLKEPLFPREADFSLLQWWKVNASKYPVLAKIARDVLAVPATTVASESAFSVGGRKLDVHLCFRSLLKHWLQQQIGLKKYSDESYPKIFNKSPQWIHGFRF